MVDRQGKNEAPVCSLCALLLLFVCALCGPWPQQLHKEGPVGQSRPVALLRCVQGGPASSKRGCGGRCCPGHSVGQITEKHGRSFSMEGGFSMPGFQKESTDGTVMSVRSTLGEWLWWQVSPQAGFRCQTVSEALAGDWQRDMGPAEGYFCLRGQLEHQDISNSTRHLPFGDPKCPNLTENLGVGGFCCPALSAVFSPVFWGSCGWVLLDSAGLISARPI